MRGFQGGVPLAEIVKVGTEMIVGYRQGREDSDGLRAKRFLDLLAGCFGLFRAHQEP